MNVMPAHAKPPPIPNNDTSRHMREQPEERLSFGEVLAAALQSRAEHEPAEAGDEGVSGSTDRAPADHYRPALEDGTKVIIGDDAVRFDARPMVGRSFAPEAPIETASSGHEALLPLMRASSDAPPLDVALARSIAMVVPRIEALVPGLIAWTVTAPGAFRRAAGSTASAAPQPLEPLARADRPAAQVRSSAPARASENKSDMPTNISLALLADEVLITVRGMDLTDGEEEALGEELRRLFAASEFGGRTVRVVTSRRS
jgi:hypothetical protein